MFHALALATSFVCLAAPPAPASLPQPLTLAQAMAHAAAHRPELARLRATAAADARRATQAGASTPPMIMAGIDKLPIMLHGVDFMVQAQYGFPLNDVREAEANAERKRAAVADADVALAAMDVPEAAALAFLDLWQAERRIASMDKALGLTEVARTLALQRFSAGAAGQGDVLRAETEHAALTGNRAVAVAMLAGRRAGLAAALGLESGAEALQIADPPTTLLAEGGAAGSTSAEQARAEAEVNAAAAQASAAAERYGAELQLQGGAMISTMEPPSLLAMVGFSFPFAGEVRDAAREEAEARLVAARAGARETTLAQTRREAEAVAELDAARTLREVLETQVRPRAEQAVSLLSQGYAAGREDIGALLDAERTLVSLEGQIVDARAEVLRRELRLARVRGLGLFQAPEGAAAPEGVK